MPFFFSPIRVIYQQPFSCRNLLYLQGFKDIFVSRLANARTYYNGTDLCYKELEFNLSSILGASIVIDSQSHSFTLVTMVKSLPRSGYGIGVPGM